jgi:Cys-rich repeat protein
MHSSKRFLFRFGLITVIAAASAGCLPTKRNTAVCCTTEEDCAALGVDGPEGWACAGGEVCVRNACVATECQASSDCSAEAPICSPDQRCVECVDSSDCGGRTCIASTNTCSECLSNSECPSGVCLTESDTFGTCASVSSVVYAAPNGLAANDCLQNAPCSIKNALAIASTHPERSVVLMSPGVYAADLEVVGGNPLTIIGNDSKVIGARTNGLRVSESADVTVIGLTINTPELISPISCNTSNGVRTKLRLKKILVTGAPFQGQLYTGSNLANCEVMMNQVTMQQHRVFLSNDSILVVDRSKFINTGEMLGTALTMERSDRTSALTMTNSVVSGGLSLDGNQAVNVSFSTIYGCETSATNIWQCNRGVEWNNQSGFGVSFRNNVIAAHSVTDAVACMNCNSLQNSFSNNVIFPQSTLIPGNFLMPPQLVDPPNGDFRLKPGSPAVDVADTVTTKHDLNGVMRPVGPRADLGAYELVP